MSSTQKIARLLRKQGYTVKVGRHLRITHPHMDGPVFSGASPSDRRVEKKLQSLLKRKRKDSGTSD